MQGGYLQSTERKIISSVCSASIRRLLDCSTCALSANSSY